MSELVSVSPGKNPRPMWLLLVLAMTLAPAAVAILKSVPFGDVLDSTRVEAAYFLMPVMLKYLPWPAELWEMGAVALIGVLTHYCLPVLLMFTLLRFSRCGSWPAMNRLALVLLVTAATGLALRMLVAVVRYWPDDRFVDLFWFWHKWLDTTLATCLFSGVAVLLLSTLWHRLVLPRPHWVRALAYFWEEK